MFEILITGWRGHLSLLGFSENTLQYLDVLDAFDRTGNIYVGRVENNVANLNAAFVRFEKGNDKHGVGFLPYKALPVSCVLNRKVTKSDEIRPGDLVLVQVKTEEQKLKQVKLTGKINVPEDICDGDTDKLIALAKTRCDCQMISADGDLDESSIYKKNVSDALDFFASLDSDEEVRLTTDITDVYNNLCSDGFSCNYFDEEQKRLPASVLYSLESKSEDLFKKRVWLQSGAFLIIEQTETLNLIDVNSGKNMKKSDSFLLELNKEAAKEAYRQIRLRNLSGMILIDFLKIKDKNMTEEFTSYVKELISNDNLNMSFIDITGLGIMEFTRNKKKKTLREVIDISDK